MVALWSSVLHLEKKKIELVIANKNNAKLFLYLFPFVAASQDWRMVSTLPLEANVASSYTQEKSLRVVCANRLTCSHCTWLVNFYVCDFNLMELMDSVHVRRCIILHSNTACCTDIIKRHRYDWHSKPVSNLIKAVSLVVSSCLVGKETARVNAVKESTCSS